MPENASDERVFAMIRQFRADHGADMTLAEFKQDFRNQFFMLMLDERRAVAAIPKLLEGDADQAPHLLGDIREIVVADGHLGPESEKRLAEVAELFNSVS